MNIAVLSQGLLSRIVAMIFFVTHFHYYTKSAGCFFVFFFVCSL